MGHGDIAEMGLLLAQAVPPVPPAGLLAAGPELIGRVVSSRWPVGGPPEELLGPAAGDRPEAGSGTAEVTSLVAWSPPEKAAAELQPAQIGFDVHPGAGGPVVLRARSATSVSR